MSSLLCASRNGKIGKPVIKIIGPSKKNEDEYFFVQNNIMVESHEFKIMYANADTHA